ncbi:MAG TPA: choice-of-anchor D domain-containing protein [Acidimicrobiales bacterium]
MRRWLGAVEAAALGLALVLVVDGPAAQAAATPFELLSVDAASAPVTGTTDVTASSTGQFVAFAQPGTGCSTISRRDRAAKATTKIADGVIPVLSADGVTAAYVSCGSPLTVQLWPSQKSVPLTGATKVTELAFSGALVAVVGEDANGPHLWLVDTAAGKVSTVTSPNGAPKSPAFYNDGQSRLAFVSGTVADRVVVTAPTAADRIPGSPDEPVTGLSISANGATAAYAAASGTSVSLKGAAAVALAPDGSDPSVSSDGGTVAVTAGGSIKTFALNGAAFAPGPTAAPVAAGSFGSPVATDGDREIVFLATPGAAAGGSAAGPQAFALRPGLTAADVDFGAVAINTTTTKPVSFRNDGTVDVTPTTIESSNAADFAVVNGGTCARGQPIKVGASCTVQVAFTPTSNGAKESTLTITQPTDQSWDGVTAAVHLTGSGANGALSADPETIDFGTVSVGETAAAQSFTVTNTGTLTTTIGTVLVSAPAEFPLAGGTCAGATLAPADTCTVSVAFKPAATGSRSATMDVGGSGGAAVSVTLSGTGRSTTPTTPVPTTVARPVLVVSPSALDFGTVLIGAAGSPQTVTIRNTGTGATSTAATITGAAAGDFALTTNGCAGRSLAAGASCTLTVAFSPQGSGARSASVTVSGTGGASATIRLSGSGQLNPVLAVSTGLVVPGQVFTAIGTNFPAGAAVTLAWDIGGPAAATTADGTGAFQVTVVAPEGVGNGTRLLVVTSPPEAVSAQASVLLQPAAFGYQGPASPAFRNSPAG